MSQSETNDLLTRLYNELAQRIVEQCVLQFQTPGFLSKLNLEEYLSTFIETKVQQATGETHTEELEQQVMLVGQMIDVLEGALQDHRTETDALVSENTTLKGQIDRLKQKTNLLEKENAQFRVEIANNRSNLLERLNSLQENIDRLQSTSL